MDRDPTPYLSLCTRCELGHKFTRPVPGVGPTIKPIALLIGEAPGQEEEQSGVPFVGRSGKLLRDLLSMNGIDIKSLRITNSVHCRPQKAGSSANGTPKVTHINACRPWLEMEIESVSPPLIVSIGATPLKSLFGTGKKAKYPGLVITQARTRSDLEYRGIPVIACLHPAAAIRSPRYMAGFVRDIQRVAEHLGTREKVDQTRNYFRVTEKFTPTGVIALDTEYDAQGKLYCWSYSDSHASAGVVLGSDPFSSSMLKGIVESAERLVFHNAKADIPPICSHLGIPVQSFPYSKVDDTMILGYLLGKKPLGLKPLAENLLGLYVIRLDDIREKGAGGFESVNETELVQYSGQDADLTLRLYNILSKEICQQ